MAMHSVSSFVLFVCLSHSLKWVWHMCPAERSSLSTRYSVATSRPILMMFSLFITGRNTLSIKDVKQLPVNWLPVLKPVTSFENVQPVIEFLLATYDGHDERVRLQRQ